MNSKRDILLLGILILLFVAALLPGFFTDAGRDAAKYAWIAREMVETGNWFTITIQGEPYTQKPPFTFWLAALSFKTFGISNFSFKLPFLLYLLLGIYAVYRLGKSLFSKQTGILAAILVMTSAIFFLYAMDIHTDTVLFTNVALSLWFLHEYLKNGKTGFLIGGGVAMGLCVLTKGVFGIMAPVFAVAAYIISGRDWKRLFPWKWLLLFLVVCVVSLPALVPLYQLKGWEGIRFFIWDNNVGRVLGNYRGIIADPMFYLHTLLYLFLPFTFLFIAGTGLQVISLFKRRFTPNDFYIFFGFWMIFLILSLSKNKLPNYLMSLVPFASVISAQAWIEKVETGTGTFLRRVQSWLLYLIWGVLFIASLSFFAGAEWYFWCLLLILFSFFICSAHFLPGRNNSRLIPTVATGVAIGLTLNMNVGKTLFSLQAAPAAARWINHNVPIHEPVYYYNPDDLRYREEALRVAGTGKVSKLEEVVVEKHFSLNYELMFYTLRPVQYIETPEQLARVVCSGPCYIFTNETGRGAILDSISETPAAIKSFPDFNPGYPFSYLQYKRGNKPFPNCYLIGFGKKMNQDFQ